MTMTKNTIKLLKGNSAKYTSPTPAPAAGTQMILPREITTYQLFPERQSLTTMCARTKMNKKRKSRKWNSNHTYSSFRDAYDGDRREYDLIIPYWKAIPDKYLRGHKDNRYDYKDLQRTLHPRPLLLPEADDSAHRYYDLAIPSRKEIHEDCDCENDDDNNKKDKKVEGGDILVVETGQPNTKRNNIK